MRTMFSTAALVALLCASPVAHAEDADDAEVTRMAKEHYKAGLDAYKAGQYETAIKELKRAYLLKRLPPLLLNIGATYRKMGDLDMSLHFYKKYLDEAPAEAKDRDEVESTIKEIEAQKAGGGAKEAAPAPSAEPAKEEAPLPRKPRVSMPTEWSHNVVDAAPPEMPLDVRVSMPVMKGVKVFVFYRGAGESEFQQVLMKRHGAEKIGRIPAEAMQGKAIQYYLEARDANGAIVKSSGTQSSPNIVMIDPSARPQIAASMEDGTAHEQPGRTPTSEVEEGRTRRDMDDEAAPIMEHQEKKRHEPGTPGTRGTLFWAGLVVGVVGVAALAAGVAFDALAGQQASAITKDAHATAAQGAPFEFKDPTAPGGKDDATFQKDGQKYNITGIALTVGGGVLAAAGVALIVVDVMKHRQAETPKTRRRPIRETETSWYVTPTVGPQLAGVGGGFSF